MENLIKTGFTVPSTAEQTPEKIEKVVNSQKAYSNAQGADSNAQNVYSNAQNVYSNALRAYSNAQEGEHGACALLSGPPPTPATPPIFDPKIAVTDQTETTVNNPAVNNKVHSSKVQLSEKARNFGKRAREEYARLQPKRRLQVLSDAQSIVAWRRALRTQRRAKPKRGIRCQICKARSNDLKSLRDHWRSRHHIKEDGSTYYCALCRLNFNSSNQERQHLCGKKHLKNLRKHRTAQANTRARLAALTKEKAC